MDEIDCPRFSLIEAMTSAVTSPSKLPKDLSCKRESWTILLFVFLLTTAAVSSARRRLLETIMSKFIVFSRLAAAFTSISPRLLSEMSVFPSMRPWAFQSVCPCRKNIKRRLGNLLIRIYMIACRLLNRNHH